MPDIVRRNRVIRSRAWEPAAYFAETFTRVQALANRGILSSGRLSVSGGLVLPAGRVVTSITMCSNAQAGGTMTNQWFSLILPDLTVLAKTVDDTSTAWAANTTKTLALASPYTPSADTAVWVGIVVVGSQMPTLTGIDMSIVAMSAMAPKMAGYSTTGLTNPASLGASITAPTTDPSAPWAAVS